MSDTVQTETTDATGAAPLKPRVGTIVWGGILLLVAAVTVFAALGDLGEVSAATAVYTAVGLGVVLVLVAIVVAIVRAARRER
jgi:hypothetical protein